MRFIPAVAALSFLLSGCLAQVNSPDRIKVQIQSVQTDLSGAGCKKEVDKTDPNETPYLSCPGVAGYTLIVRRVGSGQRSIDVVDANKRVVPLNYQEFITRHMFSLGDKAEWRVGTRDGKQVPIALIVRVQARQDNRNPDKVTHTYLAVAKLAPGQTCVTHSILDSAGSETKARSAGDSAQRTQCAMPQPQLKASADKTR